MPHMDPTKTFLCDFSLSECKCIVVFNFVKSTNWTVILYNSYIAQSPIWIITARCRLSTGPSCCYLISLVLHWLARCCASAALLPRFIGALRCAASMSVTALLLARFHLECVCVCVCLCVLHSR